MRTQIAPHRQSVQRLVLLFLIVSQLSAAGPNKEECGITGPESVPIIELVRCRPAPVSSEEKAAILASLPPDGEITKLRSGERSKIAAVEGFLQTQDRLGVYAVKVIDPPQAWVGLFERAVLLITRTALNLLSAHELTAIAAHEAAHEYVYLRYATAKSEQDSRALRRLELTCDALAVGLLQQTGLPWEPLVSAVDALANYNLNRYGVASNTPEYPSTGERKKVIRRAGQELMNRKSVLPTSSL